MAWRPCSYNIFICIHLWTVTCGVVGDSAKRWNSNKRRKQHLSLELAFPRDKHENRRNSREEPQEAFCCPKESKKSELQVIWEEMPYLSSFKECSKRMGWGVPASVGVSSHPQQLKWGAALSAVHLHSGRKSDIIHLSHCDVIGCDSCLFRDTFLPWNMELWLERENNSMKSVGDVLLMKSVFSSILPLKPKISARSVVQHLFS